MTNNEATLTQASRWRADSLATSVAILLVVTVVQRSIGFGRGILFCRWLSPDQLGMWELAYSFLLLAAPLTVLGLPGSFGRYLERHRQRGQLRTFLRRSLAWVLTLTAGVAILLTVASPLFAKVIFGSQDMKGMVLLIAASLVAVILHHFLEAMFASLRMFRVVSTMHFCQSVTFAAISLLLLQTWGSLAEVIVVGYGAACAISVAAALLWMHRSLADILPPDQPSTHRDFWPPLLRFAVWVWVTNLFSHLFAIVDRYMIVHVSGADNHTALAMVGQYHSSFLLPVLFISIADLLSGALMPYLSHDWEAGRRAEVSSRLNVMLKLTSLGMTTAGVAVLWFAPWLFATAFNGKYNDGLSILPWTLTACLWQATIIIGQNYLWCAERAARGVLPLAGGLLVNIALNYLLLPIWGILGAVVATTVATGAALAALHAMNRYYGMELRAATVVLTYAPLALAAGPLVATFVVTLLIAVALSTRLLFTTHEKNEMLLAVLEQIHKLTAFTTKHTPATSP